MKGKARFVEVWDSTNGRDAAIVSDILKNTFDVRYKRFSKGYTYYRLRATKKEVKVLAKQLAALGYYSTLTDNRYFHVITRAN